MKVRNFALLRQRDIEICQDRAISALHAWQEEWCPAADTDASACASSELSAEQRDGFWDAYRTTQGNVLWCKMPSDMDTQIKRLLFDLGDPSHAADRHRESEIADSVTNEAIADLVGNVLTKCAAATSTKLPNAEKPDDWLFRNGSGALMLKIKLGASALFIVMPAEQLSSHRDAKPIRNGGPVTPLPGALHNTHVHLVAELGDVEMTLGQLASLQIGDVISLPMTIEQPAKLATAKGHVLCNANLGQQDGKRALEIIKLARK